MIILILPERSKSKPLTSSLLAYLFHMDPNKNSQGNQFNNQGNDIMQTNQNNLNYNRPNRENTTTKDEEFENLLEDSVVLSTGRKIFSKTPFKINANTNHKNQQQNDNLNQYHGNPNPQTNIAPHVPANSFNSSNLQNIFASQPNLYQSTSDYNRAFSNPQIIQSDFQQQPRNNNRNANVRASKLDQALMHILRETQSQPNNEVGSKQASKIQEKSKMAVSRLSHQFFVKSGNPQDNIKSKNKSRQTVSSFGLDYKRDYLSKNEPANPAIQNNTFQKPNHISKQPQKMQIQVTHPKIDHERINTDSPPDNQRRNQQIFIHPEKRLSEVKKKRQRLTLGMEGLANLIKTTFGSDKKEKKPEIPFISQPAPKQNNRVTMDLNSLINFLQSKDQDPSKSFASSGPCQKQKEPKQTKSAPQINEKIKRLTEYMKPSVKAPESVIFQDQNEDEVTPLKERSIVHELLRPNFSSELEKSSRKFLSELASETQNIPDGNLTQDYYTRQIFNKFFCNLNERINAKKRQYDDLTSKKSQMLKLINNKLSQFTINAQKIVEWKKQERQIQQKISAIKQKAQKDQFDSYAKLIHEFELKLGFQLHRLQKNQLGDGFYIEFTYDDLLFRLQRNHKTNDTKCRFLQRLVAKKAKKDFEFSFEERTELIKIFTTRKMKGIRNFIPFMVLLIRYIKALEKFQLTMTHYAYVNCIKDLQFGQINTEVKFCFTTGLKSEFLFTLDILQLLQKGGIKVYDLSEKRNIELPEETLAYEENVNKISKCFVFLEKYVSQLTLSKIENSMKIK